MASRDRSHDKREQNNQQSLDGRNGIDMFRRWRIIEISSLDVTDLPAVVDCREDNNRNKRKPEKQDPHTSKKHIKAAPKSFKTLVHILEKVIPELFQAFWSGSFFIGRYEHIFERPVISQSTAMVLYQSAAWL